MDNKNNIDNDDKYVTKEINLDELYDGTVNNTVIIDPISNEEVLVSKKKTNKILIFLIILIIMLLVLYFIIHKTPVGNLNTDVKPESIKTTTTSIEQNDGSLVCTYNLNSDSQNETIKYQSYYENNEIVSSNFNYSVISNKDELTDTVSDLINQYETFYINNQSIDGANFNFTKNNKGFTINISFNYKKSFFDLLTIEDGKLLLFVKPSKDDTKESLKDSYEKKGYSCIISTEITTESDVNNE